MKLFNRFQCALYLEAENWEFTANSWTNDFYFVVYILKHCGEVYFNNFFPFTARMWSLQIGFFLTCNLNRCKGNVNRHLASLARLKLKFSSSFIFLLLTLYLINAIYPCMEWNTLKKKSWRRKYLSETWRENILIDFKRFA